MSWQWPLLLLAGVGGGLTGSIAGLASLVSYPALLAIGLAPVAANVTNTVALVFNGVGSVSASRRELRGRRARLTRLALVGVAGGAVGSVLLLAGPGGAFEKLVPVLIGIGSLSILVTTGSPLAPASEAHVDSRLALLGVLAVSIYGGYFGAAAGVLMLALLLATSSDTLARAAAVRNLVLGLANLVAAVLFAIFAPVVWSVALPLALGFFAGGRLGPFVLRHSPERLLRVVISLAGLGLAVALGLDAY